MLIKNISIHRFNEFHKNMQLIVFTIFDSLCLVFANLIAWLAYLFNSDTKQLIPHAPR